MNRHNMKSKTSLALALGASLFASGAIAADDYVPGDAVKGEKLFKKCSSCHEVGADAKNKVGPHLNGIVGRAAASDADYKYGKGLKKAGEAGLIWSEEAIFGYLKNPKKYLRKRLEDKKAKSKMTLKVKKADQRADIIAYLKTFAAPEQ